MNLRSTPLVGVELSGVDWSSAVVIFHQHLRAEPAASIKTHTFQEVLNFLLKKTALSITPSQHQTYHGRFFCVCVFDFCSTNGLPALSPPRPRKAM